MVRGTCAVFDIDDTLYLERDYVCSGFEALGRWVEKWLQIRHFAESCWGRFTSGGRGSIFDEVLRESGREPSPELIASLVEVYRSHTPAIQLAPDTAEALRSISGDSSIAVITDGPAVSQSRKAEALGLTAFANPIILTELLGAGFSKPHTRAFEEVQQSRCARTYVYIADNPAKDFIAPRRLGWVTVRLRRAGGLHVCAEDATNPPDFELPDCSMLPEILSKL